MSAASASPVTIGQTGSGWCGVAYNQCNNTNPNVAANNDAQSGLDDWFAFQLPSIGTITSATLTIYESGNYASGTGAAVWSAYRASALSIAGLSIATLSQGPVLGSVTEAAAANGTSHYVSITLDAAALTALTGAEGGSFYFGGNITNGGDIFGYYSGSPGATLTLNASAPVIVTASDTSNVPEPASIAVFGAGLATLRIARRRSAG